MAVSGSSAVPYGDSSNDRVMAETSGPVDDGDERTPSSDESSPEPLNDAEQTAQPQKRKGGRKPIYATSEERKQRNRQAQAAFRERRTEYIKQLEDTIKQHEDALRSLQQSHRGAADECLMLRYKNSLLERILLEKGVDVQAELSLKTGTPSFEHAHLAAQIAAPVVPTPLPRPVFNKNSNRRSYQTANIRPPNVGQYLPRSGSFSMPSPGGVHATSPQAASPAATSIRSSVSRAPGGMPSPASAVTSYSQASGGTASKVNSVNSRRPASSQYFDSAAASSVARDTSRSVDALNGAPIPPATAPSYAYSGPFQKHIHQLEQEYDTTPLHTLHDDVDQPSYDDQFMADDFGFQGQQQPVEARSRDDPYPPDPPISTFPRPRKRHIDATDTQAARNSAFGTFDPILDADPFGLSASMHFPTAYSFDQSPAK